MDKRDKNWQFRSGTPYVKIITTSASEKGDEEYRANFCNNY